MNNKTIGILISNIGTPEKPSTKAVRKYLAQFLSDPRVVRAPRLLWLFILYGFILPTRPKRSAKAYKKIWTEQGSPLLQISKSQQVKLERKLNDNALQKFSVKLGMRYGHPSISNALNEFKKENIEKILILPLYPQYSSATTASTFDAVSHELKMWMKIPEIRMIQNYHDFPNYIETLSQKIKNFLTTQDKPHLLFSFHGLPKEYSDLGDVYEQQCYATIKLLTEKLSLKKQDYTIAFQSRLGPKQWLQPYCDLTLKNMPSAGIKNVVVICPGFSSDCLETLEEIAIQNKEIFMEAGGESFRYIPCLNDDEEHINFLDRLVKKHVIDWQ